MGVKRRREEKKRGSPPSHHLLSQERKGELVGDLREKGERGHSFLL